MEDRCRGCWRSKLVVMLPCGILLYYFVYITLPQTGYHRDGATLSTSCWKYECSKLRTSCDTACRPKHKLAFSVVSTFSQQQLTMGGLKAFLQLIFKSYSDLLGESRLFTLGLTCKTKPFHKAMLSEPFRGIFWFRNLLQSPHELHTMNTPFIHTPHSFACHFSKQ